MMGHENSCERSEPQLLLWRTALVRSRRGWEEGWRGAELRANRVNTSDLPFTPPLFVQMTMIAIFQAPELLL
jgi:hypothetical protein